MVLRKLGKDAFDFARNQYHEHQQRHESSQYPGQHQQHPQQPYPYQNPQQPPPVPYASRPQYNVTYDPNAQQMNPAQYQPMYPAPQAPLQRPEYAQTQASYPASGTGQLENDIFVPLKSTPIAVPEGPPHPVSRHCVHSRDGPLAQVDCHPAGTQPANPLQTNAFYANFLLGEQGCSVWTHPYTLCWAKGNGNARSWGLAISQTDREQLAFGPPTSTGASQYYINPVGIQSIILSAKELGEQTRLSMDSLQAFSGNVNLAPGEGQRAVVSFPMLQGMGFVTAVYKGATILVQSSVFLRSFEPAGSLDGGRTGKWRIVLEDGKTWLLYVTSSGGPVEMRMVNNTTIEGPTNFTGHVQVARLPPGSPEEFYDRSAGAYAISCTISARVYGNQGTYTMSWAKGGAPKPLIMYALPHHMASFTRTTSPNITPMRLQTTTKGMATAVLADAWQMNETILDSMGFVPASLGQPTRPLSPAAVAAIVDAGRREVEQDVMGQCCLDSMYFSGKGLGKFAMMAIALHDMAGERDLAFKILEKLKQAFAVFVENKQRCNLIYERGWRGVVSKVGMENAGADFGNGYYNDHHFHYGYFVYAAAVIAHLDPSWSNQGTNTAWVNTLVRDFANPVNDADFPFHRAFDWFHGHSWAKGLFESGDGKDEESTSEDSFASYALKMWGKASGDANLEARGNLMLAIQARVFQTYFLMESTNQVQPPQMLANKVTGITFENKIDHATYFGMNPEYIQGIHMIPLAPPSTIVRTKRFVREEWDTYFSNGRVDQVGGGWRGILYANLALVDPQAAWRFFSQPNFDWGWLDGGASRTWYLAWCAALGGV